MTFITRLRTAQARTSSALCVGLDPDPDRLPPHLLQEHALPEATLTFHKAIVEATAPFCCAFKLNFAFFEALGPDGWQVLKETCALIPETHLVIADAKRGDIGNSARFYARSVFDKLGCDAITVAPYMGGDAIRPFLQVDGTAAFVLGRTSNPGAADFQETVCDGSPLYMRVAKQVAAWDAETPGTAGLVVGATDLEGLRAIRGACPATPFLIPGVGAQGGNPEAVMDIAATALGLVLVNSSRGILYASNGPDFADAAAREAARLQRVLRPPAG